MSDEGFAWPHLKQSVKDFVSQLGSVSLIPYGMHAFIILNLVTNELVCQSKIEDVLSANKQKLNEWHILDFLLLCLYLLVLCKQSP
jgi:predicted nucleic acid-binding Zn ribbon protein